MKKLKILGSKDDNLLKEDILCLNFVTPVEVKRPRSKHGTLFNGNEEEITKELKGLEILGCIIVEVAK